MSPKHSIPKGYRFLPTKEEIIVFYLQPLINGEPLPSDAIVGRDIYGENKEPWKLFNKDSKDSIWVFTKLKKKSKSKIERTAGCGCWLNRSNKEVRNSRGKLLGFHRYFTFSYKKANSSRGDNGNWIMHEYSLKDDEGSRVICEIRNKDAEEKTRGKKSKTPAVDDEDVDARMSVKKVCDHEGNASTDKNNQDSGHQQNHNPTLDTMSCSSSSPQVNILEWPGQSDFLDGSIFNDKMDQLEPFSNVLGWKDFENNGILVPPVNKDFADEGHGSSISGTLSLDHQTMIRSCKKRKTPEVDDEDDAGMSVKKVCDHEGNASTDKNNQDSGHQQNHNPTLDTMSCSSSSAQVNIVEWPGQSDFLDGSVFSDKMDQLEAFGNVLGWKDFENNGILVPPVNKAFADEGHGSSISGILSLDHQTMIRSCKNMDETHEGQPDRLLNHVAYFSHPEQLLFVSDDVPEDMLEQLLFGSDDVPDMASSSIEDQTWSVS